jgi:uncharacterized protein YukE
MSQPNLLVDSTTLNNLIREIHETQTVLINAEVVVTSAAQSAPWQSSEAAPRFQAAMQAWREEFDTCVTIVNDIGDALNQTLNNFVAAEMNAAINAGR